MRDSTDHAMDTVRFGSHLVAEAHAAGFRVCPIDFDDLKDPVCRVRKQYYNATALASWVRRGNATDPVTRAPYSALDISKILMHTSNVPSCAEELLRLFVIDAVGVLQDLGAAVPISEADMRRFEDGRDPYATLYVDLNWARHALLHPLRCAVVAEYCEHYALIINIESYFGAHIAPAHIGRFRREADDWASLGVESERDFKCLKFADVTHHMLRGHYPRNAPRDTHAWKTCATTIKVLHVCSRYGWTNLDFDETFRTEEPLLRRHFGERCPLHDLIPCLSQMYPIATEAAIL